MKTGRVVHPAVDGDDRQRSGDAGNRDRNAAGEVRAGREPAPAVDVDADEDRFEKERETFNRKAETEDAPEPGGEARPQEPHLETEDRPGHDPSREQSSHHLRP